MVRTYGIIFVVLAMVSIAIIVSVVIHFSIVTPLPPQPRPLASSSQYLKPVHQPANGSGF